MGKHKALGARGRRVNRGLLRAQMEERELGVVLVRGFAQEEVGSAREILGVVAGPGVTGVREGDAVGLDPIAERSHADVGHLVGRHAEGAHLEHPAVLCQGERVGLPHDVATVLRDQQTREISEPLRRVERQTGLALRPVVQGIESRDHVQEVVGVTVGDEHRPDLADREVLLETGERARPGVHPQMESAARHDVPAAFAAGAGPGALRTQHGQLHATSPAGNRMTSRWSRS